MPVALYLPNHAAYFNRMLQIHALIIFDGSDDSDILRTVNITTAKIIVIIVIRASTLATAVEAAEITFERR